jgi:hypothetical protein
MEKPTEHSLGQKPAPAPTPPKGRAKWQALRYEKLDAAKAQTGVPNFGIDNTSYS